MQDLHLVGITTDRRHLIFSTRRGAKSGSFLVAIDDEVATAVELLAAEAAERAEEAPPPPKVEARLSVKEVQARLRAGEAVDDVADDAGVPAEWVERFAPPVRAELGRIVERAMATHLVRPRAGRSARPLGAAVADAMAERGISFTSDGFAAAWSSRLVGGDHWVVEFSYEHRGRSRTLAWSYDAGDGALTTKDRTASQVAFVAPVDDPAGQASSGPEVDDGRATAPTEAPASAVGPADGDPTGEPRRSTRGDGRADVLSPTGLSPRPRDPDLEAAKRAAAQRAEAQQRREAEQRARVEAWHAAQSEAPDEVRRAVSDEAAARHEADRQEAARREAARREASRQERARREAAEAVEAARVRTLAARDAYERTVAERLAAERAAARRPVDDASSSGAPAVEPNASGGSSGSSGPSGSTARFRQGTARPARRDPAPSPGTPASAEPAERPRPPAERPAEPAATDPAPAPSPQEPPRRGPISARIRRTAPAAAPPTDVPSGDNGRHPPEPRPDERDADGADPSDATQAAPPTTAPGANGRRRRRARPLRAR